METRGEVEFFDILFISCIIIEFYVYRTTVEILGLTAKDETLMNRL